jgi:hypothetical protein
VLTVGREARTEDQKLAVEQLKRAANLHAVHLAVTALKQAFQHGKYDADGYLR